MNLNQLYIVLLMLGIISPTTGYALATDEYANTSANETTMVNTTATFTETIEINEDIPVINITEDSNDTTVTETVIKEEKKNSSPGFRFSNTMMVLIATIIVIMVMVRKNKGEVKK